MRRSSLSGMKCVKPKRAQESREEWQSGDTLQPIVKPLMPATCRGGQDQPEASATLGAGSVENGSWSRSEEDQSLVSLIQQ